MSTPTGYTRAQIGLHWLTAILVVTTWILHESMEEIAEARIEEGLTPALPLHGWLGLAVLAVVAVRLVLRMRHGAPPPPANDPPLQRSAAIWGHRLLYALLIVVPLGGAGTWFLRMEDSPHGIIANLLMLVALGHAALALVHHYVRKDDVLRRMMRPEG